MSKQIDSRFITYPSRVEKVNHTVLLIDADLEEVEVLANFCTQSKRNYDIYLYKGSTGDLEWLAHLTADHTFIKNTSTVSASTAERYSSIQTLADYFTKIDDTVGELIV